MAPHPNAIDSSALPARRAPWLKLLLWALIAAVLALTFMAYGQVDLLIQWYTTTFC